MSEIERYEPCVELDIYGDPIPDMDDTQEGQYVKHSDHKAETSKLKARISELEAKVGPSEFAIETLEEWVDCEDENQIIPDGWDIITKVVAYYRKATVKAKRGNS
jgi:hypothetical protein